MIIKQEDDKQNCLRQKEEKVHYEKEEKELNRKLQNKFNKNTMSYEERVNDKRQDKIRSIKQQKSWLYNLKGFHYIQQKTSN